jgi:putative addiction module component (TIGR02574 family)
MKDDLHTLPIVERIQLVEDLWDSIASDQGVLPLTDAQKVELDRRLDAYDPDGDKGRKADEVIQDIRKRL